jgi:hypothetical protein
MLEMRRIDEAPVQGCLGDGGAAFTRMIAVAGRQFRLGLMALCVNQNLFSPS